MPGPQISVTDHAVMRWRERVDPAAVSAAAIVAVLTGPAIVCAAEFGARVVRIGRGRVILKHHAHGAIVVTVVPADEWLPQQLMPAERGGPMPIEHERALLALSEGA